MCDLLDADDRLTAPLPEGFDEEQWVKEIDAKEWEKWKQIPLFEHPPVEPPTNETYWEFGRLRKRMGLGPDGPHDTQYNLVRASCEYLTAQREALPTLSEVAAFLGQGWQPVLAQLESYPPVVPLLAYTQYLVGCRPDSPEPHGHVDYAVRDAYDYVQECLNFLAKQAERAQAQAEEAAWHQQRAEEKAASDKRFRRAMAVNMVVQMMLLAAVFGLGVGLGWVLAHR